MPDELSRRTAIAMGSIAALGLALGDTMFNAIPASAITPAPFQIVNWWSSYAINATFAAHKARVPASENPGVDFQMSVGTQLRAPHAGTLTIDQAGSLWQANIVNGIYRSELLHTSGFVGGNRQVVLGDIVALSGGKAGAPGSGNATGPHLHWTLKINGSQVDPLLYVNTSQAGIPLPPPIEEDTMIQPIHSRVIRNTATGDVAMLHPAGVAIWGDPLIPDVASADGAAKMAGQPAQANGRYWIDLDNNWYTWEINRHNQLLAAMDAHLKTVVRAVLAETP